MTWPWELLRMENETWTTSLLSSGVLIIIWAARNTALDVFILISWLKTNSYVAHFKWDANHYGNIFVDDFIFTDCDGPFDISANWLEMGKRNSHQNWKAIREQTGDSEMIILMSSDCWLSEHHCSGGGEAGALLDGGGGYCGVRGSQEDPAPAWSPDGRGGQVWGDRSHAARGHLVWGQGGRGLVSAHCLVLVVTRCLVCQVWPPLSPGHEGQAQGRRARGVRPRGGEDPGARGQHLDGERWLWKIILHFILNPKSQGVQDTNFCRRRLPSHAYMDRNIGDEAPLDSCCMNLWSCHLGDDEDSPETRVDTPHMPLTYVNNHYNSGHWPLWRCDCLEHFSACLGALPSSELVDRVRRVFRNYGNQCFNKHEIYERWKVLPPLLKIEIVLFLVVMSMISGLKIANPEIRPPSSRNSTSTLYSRDLKNKCWSRDQWVIQMVLAL